MYLTRSFFICMLCSFSLATVNSLSLHLCQILCFLSKNTTRSSRPPSWMIHHRSIVPVCMSVFEFTGHVSMPFVIMIADSSAIVYRNVSVLFTLLLINIIESSISSWNSNLSIAINVFSESYYLRTNDESDSELSSSSSDALDLEKKSLFHLSGQLRIIVLCLRPPIPSVWILLFFIFF